MRHGSPCEIGFRAAVSTPFSGSFVKQGSLNFTLNRDEENL